MTLLIIEEGAYLVFAKEGKVEENLQRFCIGSQNNELSLSSVQGLGGCRSGAELDLTKSDVNPVDLHTLVRSLLQLLVVESLLQKLQNRGTGSRISERERLGLLGIRLINPIRPINTGSSLQSHAALTIVKGQRKKTKISATAVFKHHPHNSPAR